MSENLTSNLLNEGMLQTAFVYLLASDETASSCLGRAYIKRFLLPTLGELILVRLFPTNCSYKNSFIHSASADMSNCVDFLLGDHQMQIPSAGIHKGGQFHLLVHPIETLRSYKLRPDFAKNSVLPLSVCCLVLCWSVFPAHQAHKGITTRGDLFTQPLSAQIGARVSQQAFF